MFESNLFKVRIDYKSLFEKGIKCIKDDFFIRLICGAMGTGKSYLAIKLVEDSKEEKGRVIKTNIKSYKSNFHEVIYFDTIDDIVHDEFDNYTYIIDELGRRFTKECKQHQGFYAWLQQSRKHNRHVYLILQEYIQVPQWLRGVATKVFITRKLPFLPLYISCLGSPFLDTEGNYSWSISPEFYFVYKRTKKIALCYDTLESIDTL